MIRSMTAFSRHEHGAAVWEIRSVNHRYLDVSFRMPEKLRHLETELKSQFKDKVQRGKIECSLKVNPGELKTRISINQDLVQDLHLAMGQVAEITGMEDRGDILSLLRWPDVLTTEESGDELIMDAQQSFTLAVDQLVEMREREGRELARLLDRRLIDIETTVEKLREETPAIITHQHERLLKRLGDIDVEVEPGRVEQELVILAQKLDVAEELDRLVTHVLEVRRNLKADEPVGRRLDFLMQELNREANTLSSKAAATSTTMQAVDLKVSIEQMREQIQNIE
ncbi:MAG: YicC family protein [Gammaproteobacteria bacterium]|nr:YicC family protein [Gammaproteobacteria bacterium]MBT4379012.1 YicC family protein [Gammaproteobacteria bacterium]MBT4616666.1 YicC family protein [Gammaproteobacteria bacterium]MBT5441872.1 YicC family protein [Gammaproteobacteria bacterium]MBT5791261.1 YicC family protein [Gammaproteobacteria bacterium]